MKTENTIEKTGILLENYLKDNKESYRIEKIREANYQLLQSQRNSIYDCLNLGRLFSEALENFNSPVNKQLRKEIGLKISVEYFISQAYNGFSKAWVYRLVQAYKLGEDIHKEYLDSGNVNKELSIAGLLKFANKEEVSEEASEEASEEVSEEASEEASEQVTKFGGITISIDKAAKEDIIKAIEYLQSLAK